MFARILSMQLKPNASAEFVELFEKTIVSTLREQSGFKDEMLFVTPGGPEVVAISLWESRETAERYHRTTYPELLKALTKVIERGPAVGTFQLAYSTLHEKGAVAFPPQSPNTTAPSGVGA